MISLENRTALVTAASYRGIGAATIKAICDAGGHKVLHVAGNTRAAAAIANTICFLASGLAPHAATRTTVGANGTSYVR